MDGCNGLCMHGFEGEGVIGGGICCDGMDCGLWIN